MSSVPATGRSTGGADPVAQRTAAVPTVNHSTTRTSGDPYVDLADELHARGVQVWFEADMVKRWLEGPASFAQALDRLARLGRVPGVRGFKVADELGYHDGLASPAQAREFLRAVRTGLAERGSHAEVLVDVVVPDLGCLGWTAVGSPDCARAAQAKTPAACASAVGSYLRAGLIDRL